MKYGTTFLLALSLGCAGPSWRQTPHDRYFQRTPAPKPHVRPKSAHPYDWWYAIVHTTARPFGEVLSPGHYVDMIAGEPRPLDVNEFGQVLDSTWFFNRINRYALSPEEVARGPNRLDGAAPGPLDVLGGKLEGATPGLIVQDQRGIVFVVKFDPPAYPELASNAEVIATKILYAAGYNVPENYVVDMELSRLVLSPDAVTSGEYGEEVPLTPRRLDDLLTHVNPYPNGRVRALFSRYLEGEIIGPFSYRGLRTDDPNDRIPHEDRRSLRGLSMFSAWLNNTDTRSSNTLDVFVPTRSAGPKLGYVKHYLLDFGDALGAAGVKPKYVGQGYQHRIDWGEIGAGIFSIGIYYPPWLAQHRSPYRSVGVFEAEVFSPELWAPTIPNPAFDKAGILDRYWAASIIARFTPDQLAAVVRSASYSERGAAEWVLRVLSQRQFAILQQTFRRVLPLEDPRVEGGTILAMTDLAVKSNLISEGSRRYRYDVEWKGETLATGAVDRPRIDLGSVIDPETASTGDPFFTVTWGVAGKDGPTTKVHLRAAGRVVFPVGMTRVVD